MKNLLISQAAVRPLNGLLKSYVKDCFDCQNLTTNNRLSYHVPLLKPKIDLKLQKI